MTSSRVCELMVDEKKCSERATTLQLGVLPPSGSRIAPIPIFAGFLRFGLGLLCVVLTTGISGEGCVFAPKEGCACPAIYAPVCGKDGRSYGNRCAASCERVAVEHEGKCESDCPQVDCPESCSVSRHSRSAEGCPSCICSGKDGSPACLQDEDCLEGSVCDVVNFCDSPPGCEQDLPCPTVCYGRCVWSPEEKAPAPSPQDGSEEK